MHRYGSTMHHKAPSLPLRYTVVHNHAEGTNKVQNICNGLLPGLATKAAFGMALAT
jgi:hypothetical protein